MLTENFRKLVVPLARNLMIIWGAFLTAPLIYLFIAWTLGRQDGFAEGGADAGLLGMVGALVMVLLVGASIVFERRAYSSATLRAKLAEPPSFDRFFSRQTKGTAAARTLFESLPESEQKLACMFPHFQTTQVVIWAFREAVAVVGLALAILARDFTLALPFCLAGLVLVGIKPPRSAAFFEAIRS
jgi:hypothetical protein